MAGKTLFPTEGNKSTGIGEGTPFVVNRFTAVQQTLPTPTLFTQRLGLLLDTFQSIVAPGSLGAVHSFVVGEDAEDSANGDRAVLVGYKLRQSGAVGAGLNADQTLVGNSIQLPALGTNAQHIVAVGDGITWSTFAAAPTIGSSVYVGSTIAVNGVNGTGGDSENNVGIGAGITLVAGGNVVIGAGAATTGQQAVAVGQQAATGTTGVALGFNCIVGTAGGDASVGVGHDVRAGQGCTVVGARADCNGGTSSIALGFLASTGNATGAIAIGREASNAVNQFALIGSRTFPILNFRFGGGLNDSTGGNVYTFQGTDIFGGAGNNLEGNGLRIAAGVGTGNWANTQNIGLELQAGLAVASGSAQQTYTTVLAIRHADLNVALWGGLAAPFSGGAGVLFMANAATNPTVAAVAGGGILSVQGGNLHFLNEAGVDTALTPGAGGSFLPLAGGTMTGNILVTPNNGVNVGAVATRLNTVYTLNVSSGATLMRITSTAVTGDIIFSPNAVDTVAVTQNGPGGALYPSAAGVKLGVSALPWSALFVDGAVSITLTSQTTTVGAQVGTLTNTPTAGNPTGYLHVNIDGAVGKIPYWV